MTRGNMTQLLVIALVALLIGIWIGKTFLIPSMPGQQMDTKGMIIEKPAILSMTEQYQKEFPNKKLGFEFDVVTQTDTGSVELFKIHDKVPNHQHAKENHILYIVKGKATGTIGDISGEVKEGDLVIIPAGVPHNLQNAGTGSFNFILFSTPPFNAEDIEVLEG